MGSSSARAVGGSQSLLQRIRARDAASASASAADTASAAGTADATGHAANPESSVQETEASAEALLRDVVAFLRARVDGRAPTGLVVDAFQDRLGDSQHALFKRLLKVAATLEKNPPTMGGGGGTVWVLKEEFMRVV